MSCNICVKDAVKSLTDPQNVMESINYLHCMCASARVCVCVCVRLCRPVCVCVSSQASMQLLQPCSKEGVGPRRAEISFSAC